MKQCKFCGKEGRIIKGLCMKHYTQQRLLGEVRRTKFDKNEIIARDGCAEMLLYNQKGEVKSKTTIDVEDIVTVSLYKWSLDKHGYVVNPRSGLRLNRYLMNPTKEQVVDHIDRNPLNNKKENLRCVSQLENTLNKNLGKKGVTQRGNKWVAYIKEQGKKKHLGTFATYEEAREARNNAEIQKYGRVV